MLRFLVLCDACFFRRFRLCRCFFAARFKLLNAAGGVDQLFLAGEERMAGGANFNLELRLGRADFKNGAACAGDFRFRKIGRMDILFHNSSIIHGYYFLTRRGYLVIVSAVNRLRELDKR